MIHFREFVGWLMFEIHLDCGSKIQRYLIIGETQPKLGRPPHPCEFQKGLGHGWSLNRHC